MNIDTITVGPFEVNCYIVRGVADDLLVIDPGADASRIRELLRGSVAAYLLTHGHADHVSALADLMSSHPAPVYLHEADMRWAFTDRNQIPPYYAAPAPPNGIVHYVTDGAVYSEGGFRFCALETPGHTPGGVCFWFPNEGILFSGDTLFNGSVGRTDLPGGSARLLSASLQKIAGLPDHTRVYPGHGPATTIGAEKKTNAFLMGCLRKA
jgi:hydroxyacylglutathione hydrolase